MAASEIRSGGGGMRGYEVEEGSGHSEGGRVYDKGQGKAGRLTTKCAGKE